MSAAFWGCLLRFCQGLLQAAPFIIVGLFVAAILRRLLGKARTRQLFGTRGKGAIVRAWLWGMLLPVDSLGVIPICRELKRAGVGTGSIVAFALTAPLFNPLSLLYGLTLSEPFAIFAFAGLSFVVVTLLGVVCDRIFPTAAPEPETPEDAEVGEYGLKRMGLVLLTAIRESGLRLWSYLLIGLAGGVGLCLLLPPGSLGTSFNGDDPLAPARMVGVAIPVYATPMLAMSQVGSMFAHGGSVGASFVLLALGTGLNLGVLLWVALNLGWRQAGAWLLSVSALVTLLAYTVDKPLAPAAVDVSDHTHAFDVYAQPYHRGAEDLPQRVWNKLSSDAQPFEILGLGLLLLLSIAALVVNRVDPEEKIEARWSQKVPTEAAAGPWYNRPLPSWCLGGAALLMIVVLSIVGCFAYYPAATAALDEASSAKTRALSAALAGNAQQTKYWAERVDDWTRRLQVGVWLRRRELPDYHRMKAELLIKQLEMLEHLVADEETEQVGKLISQVSRSFGRLRVAFEEELD